MTTGYIVLHLHHDWPDDDRHEEVTFPIMFLFDLEAGKRILEEKLNNETQSQYIIHPPEWRETNGVWELFEQEGMLYPVYRLMPIEIVGKPA